MTGSRTAAWKSRTADVVLAPYVPSMRMSTARSALIAFCRHCTAAPVAPGASGRSIEQPWGNRCCVATAGVAGATAGAVVVGATGAVVVGATVVVVAGCVVVVAGTVVVVVVVVDVVEVVVVESSGGSCADAVTPGTRVSAATVATSSEREALRERSPP